MALVTHLKAKGSESIHLWECWESRVNAGTGCDILPSALLCQHLRHHWPRHLLSQPTFWQPHSSRTVAKQPPNRQMEPQKLKPFPKWLRANYTNARIMSKNFVLSDGSWLYFLFAGAWLTRWISDSDRKLLKLSKATSTHIIGQLRGSYHLDRA